MARPKRELGLQNPHERVKQVARQQMAELGTAGLSLRAIAREMAITAPAIYNYFPRLEDMITALIVDAFTALGDAIEQADAVTGSNLQKMRSMIMTYRQWAVEHPVDFQLIFGNPIPGYVAPMEVTAPLARRPFQTLYIHFAEAQRQQEIRVPACYQQVPGEISAHLARWKREADAEVDDALFCLLMIAWARIHGMVVLELNHHLQPTIGDAEALYRFEVDVLLAQLGRNN